MIVSNTDPFGDHKICLQLCGILVWSGLDCECFTYGVVQEYYFFSGLSLGSGFEAFPWSPWSTVCREYLCWSK